MLSIALKDARLKIKASIEIAVLTTPNPIRKSRPWLWHKILAVVWQDFVISVTHALWILVFNVYRTSICLLIIFWVTNTYKTSTRLIPSEQRESYQPNTLKWLKRCGLENKWLLLPPISRKALANFNPCLQGTISMTVVNWLLTCLMDFTKISIESNKSHILKLRIMTVALITKLQSRLGKCF